MALERYMAMETFVRVVDAGTLTAAAERLNVAKSVVSRRLGELESHLGVQLLHRTTRSLTLTDTGRAYYDQCVRLLADLREVEAAVAERACTLTGRLRVAAPLSFGIAHLTEAIADFLAAHPAIDLELDLNDRRVDIVQEGFDLAVRIGELADSTLIARRLAPIRHVVCASPAYLAAHGTPRTPEDLKRHRILHYANRADRSWPYQAADGTPGRVPIRPTLLASNGDILVELACRDRGIVLEPTFIAWRALASGRLVRILSDYDWLGTSCFAVYPPTRHLTRRVRVFVDFLAERFADIPYWDREPGGAPEGGGAPRGA